jgi:hypothetical protein
VALTVDRLVKKKIAKGERRMAENFRNSPFAIRLSLAELAELAPTCYN